VFQAALDCLQRTGVEVSNLEARNLLESAGADVEETRVRIPSRIIQDAIATNPRSFTIYGRDPKMRLQVTYGTPEMSLYSAAVCEIFKYLNLPFMGTAGASDSKLTDMQAAIESTTQIMLSSLSGANLVHDIGFLDCADIGSLEMLVMSDEIIAMTKRIMRGIEITDETLMLDLIDEVGPSGEYISSDETARRCRKEITQLHLMDRDPWVTWEENDSMTLYNRIRLRLHHILENHKPIPVTDGIESKIGDILNAAEEQEAKAVNQIS